MSNRFITLIVVFASIILLANSGNHPTSGTGGYTGAPGDGVCSSCHGGSGGGMTGTIDVTGFPSSIVANTTYNLTITVTNTGGSPSQAGFQMVALNGSNTNSGTLVNNGPNTSLKTTNGRTYVGHNPAQPLTSSGTVSWNVDWTAPSGPNGETITFWAGAIMGNGGNGNGQDKFIASSTSGTLTGATAPVSVNVVSLNDVSCNGGNDGSAMATATGGTGTFSYLWDNGEMGSTATMLTAGMHTVVATDGVGSTGSTSIVINEPAPLTGMVINQNAVLCNGDANGSANLNASGGTSPYSFTWPDGTVISSRTDLAAGTYTITVSDNLMCTSTMNVAISEPPVLGQSLVNSSDASCGMLDGSIEVIGIGGVGAYSYLWSDGTSGPIISGIPAGTYTVVVTDGNMCTNSASYTISSSSGISLSLNSSSDPTCNGGANGTAEINVTGGTMPFSAMWSDGGSGLIRNDLSANTYNVIVSDQMSCSSSISITIGEPSSLGFTVSELTMPSCIGDSDGQLIVEASGGTAPYTYTWPGGIVNDTLSNLTAGTYQVTITDNNMCTDSFSATLSDPSIPTIDIDSIVSPLCNGDNNGIVALTLSGGTGTLNVTWPDANTDTLRNDLQAGLYWVTISDSNNCMDSSSIIISQPSLLIANATGQAESNAGANDGTAVANPTGGIPPYSYHWSTGDMTQMISGLSPGNYVVTVTDDNDCSSEEIVAVSPGNCTITGTVSTTPVSCFGDEDGTATISLMNAVGAVDIMWSTGDSTLNIDSLETGVYAVTVTDALSCQVILSSVEVTSPGMIIVSSDVIEIPECANESTGIISANITGGTGPYNYNWDLGSTADTLVGVFPGSYPVTVTDDNMCTGNGVVNLGNADFTKPNSVLIDLTLYADAAGNIPSFDETDFDGGSSDNCGIAGFSWDDMEYGCDDIGVHTIYVDVFDNNGNVEQDSFILTILDTIPPNVICTQDLTTTSCEVVNYTIPSGFDNCGISDIRLVSGPESGSFFNIGTTEVQYEIEDNGNNIALCSFFVTVTADMEAEVSNTDVTCFELEDGSVSYSFSGTNLPFEVTYEDASIDPNMLAAGSYPITITDAEQCFILDTIEIAQPDPIEISNINVVDASTSNSTDGSISIDVNGGTGTYTFQWFLNGGIVGISKDLDNLAPGIYSLIIVDENQCVLESMEIIVGSVVSTDNLEIQAAIDIYPIPAQDFITVSSNDHLFKISELQLLDLSGKLVWKKKTSQVTNNIDLEGINNGIYILNVLVNEELMSQKVTILR